MNNKYINIKIDFQPEYNEIILANISDFPFLGVIDNDDNFLVSFNVNDFNTVLSLS